MSNMYANVKKNIGESPMILLMFPLTVILFVIAIGISYQDYLSSLHGYLLLPTQKINPEGWVTKGIAFLPQGLPIIIFYGLTSNTKSEYRNLKIMIMLLLFLVDTFTDVNFKVNGNFDDISLVATAIVETIVVYTGGSEILLTMSWGLMMVLAAPFFDFFGLTFGEILLALVKAISYLISKIIEAVATVFTTIVSDNK